VARKIEQSWIDQARELARVMKHNGVIATPEAGFAARVDHNQKQLVVLCDDVRLRDDDFIPTTKQVWAAIGYKWVDSESVVGDATQFVCDDGAAETWNKKVTASLELARANLQQAMDRLVDSGFDFKFPDKGSNDVGFRLFHKGELLVEIAWGQFKENTLRKDKFLICDLTTIQAVTLAAMWDSGAIKEKDLPRLKRGIEKEWRLVGGNLRIDLN